MRVCLLLDEVGRCAWPSVLLFIACLLALLQYLVVASRVFAVLLLRGLPLCFFWSGGEHPQLHDGADGPPARVSRHGGEEVGGGHETATTV